MFKQDACTFADGVSWTHQLALNTVPEPSTALFGAFSAIGLLVRCRK
ncbi:PEP-CTERM sorting domain-containing protein [Akkermansiaceae bacterium]|nr:PEP-CTERM sorting domain-containing protein [Akkermansiaceae bacterium]MDB4723519.1 PEP-CTERM sorting domain-containing protein [Akkermansiaceae bacterium]MDC0321058.1 PEP-CTERM sorting domain-containing protein [Akkermansiaceae bacterium]MDC0568474.1 PEP-CTERM sorting domain-containing protein [Akkermansiaceae bacterium]